MNPNAKKVAFAICIAAGEDDDLQVWKVYRLLPDPKAAAVACLRVIDDSGEDYLYSAQPFVVLDLPAETRKRLLAAGW